MNKDNEYPASFVGRTERFYVLRNEGLKNPAIPKKYAVYHSTNACNRRTEIPDYVSAQDAIGDFSHEIKVNPATLTTIWPAKVDKANLSISRTNWKERLNRAHYEA